MDSDSLVSALQDIDPPTVDLNSVNINDVVQKTCDIIMNTASKYPVEQTNDDETWDETVPRWKSGKDFFKTVTLNTFGNR